VTRGLRALLIASCAGAVACSGARSKTAAAPAAESPASGSPAAASSGGDPRAQIEALDRQITDELARAHVAPPAVAGCTGAACAAAMSAPFATPTTSDPACHPAATERCKDACTLSTSICDNQQKICDLANQLAGDDWAAGRCEHARASCQAAHDSCCSCVL
jgi:hypothetical protein